MKRRGNPCRADYPLTMSSPFLYSVQSRPCAFAGAASPTLKTTTDRGAAWRKFLNPSDNSSWFHSHLLPASRIFVTFFLFPMKPALMSSAKGKLNLISTLSSPHRGLSARGNKRNIITTVKISPIIPICSSQEAPTTQVSESPYCNYSPQIPKLQIILLNFRMPSSPSTPSYTAGIRKMHSGSARIIRNLPSSNYSPQNGKMCALS